LRQAGEQAPGDVELWTRALAAARAADDDDQRQEILARLIDASADRVKQSFWLNEAWEVAKKRGQPELATEILKRWLGVDPEDTQALPWRPAFDQSDDLDGLLSAKSPLLARAFRGARQS